MNKPSDPVRTGGGDAVCFTAGPKGAVFGIGVIHAWLAADRKAPEAAAGISAGALTAAAMQYSFRALEDPAAEGDVEVRRWTWFRKYLDTLSDSPLDIVWKAIPDPVDFFADKPPVKDLSRPPSLDKAEAAARRDHYVLTKLGTWLAGLPVSVRTVASAAITYVRWKERYGMWGFMWFWFVATVAKIATQLLYQLCFPSFFSQRTFRAGKEPGRLNWLRYHIWSWRFRPLFGWRVWLVSIVAAGLLVYSAVGVLFYVAQQLPAGVRPPDPGPIGTVIFVGTMAGVIIVIALLARKRTRNTLLDWATSQVLEGLGLPRGLLNDYQLHRRLLELFADDANAYPAHSDGPLLEERPIQLVLVATALQKVTWKGKQLRSQQVWAEPNTPLTQALRAALCVQGLFPPLRLSTPKDIGNWVDSDGLSQLDLVDGAGVSQNPLPAFFGWLKSHTDVAQKLRGDTPDDRRVHIVYSVPIQPYQPAEAQPERMNIVEVAFVSRELERRRDTRQEARQTNFISQLELYVSKTGGRPHSNEPPLFPIFVDEIAPEKDVAFQNNLDPKADEIRKTAAAGCRQTLETLYRDELATIRAVPIPCHELLTRIAPRRARRISPDCPALREICSHCTRELRHRPLQEGPAEGVYPSFGQSRNPPQLLPQFRHLSREQPRIVFLASGGVFRGSFHAGTLAAMQALNIKPDLVVGASVGALMGGALCAISVLEGKKQSLDAQKLLEELAGTFLCVDQKVALTRTLKNTIKQLGVRALRIHLSPAKLRGMIRRGTRADAGFAAVGAPPALIDAISDLFVIPHGRTRAIASEFIAGHIAAALNRFWRQVQKETLPSLDIETFLMGTSLLEPRARMLLGEKFGISLKDCQPYHRADKPVSFFCTTSDLHRRSSLLLGRDFLHAGDFLQFGSYDFVNAALSSSAFPAVFAPRSESHLLPGQGYNDVLLADGGMFDNLPFFPAIELLRDVQVQYRQTYMAAKHPKTCAQKSLEFLRQRQAAPDLIIAAALDANPVDTHGNFSTLASVLDRVSSLEKNVKSKSFADTAELVGRQTRQLLANKPALSDSGFIKFIDELVPAGVLQIIPTDREHINPTFAFCKSMGMEARRVERSIADGCFQTVFALASAQEGGENFRKRFAILDASIRGLRESSRIPLVKFAARKREVRNDECPYFTMDNKPLACPFMRPGIEDNAVRNIRNACARDPKHIDLVFKRQKQSKPARQAVNRPADRLQYDPDRQTANP